MSNEFILEAEVRETAGKGSSRRLRRLEEKVPAIIYGGKGKKPLSISILENKFAHAIENEAFFSHIITLNVGGDKEEVILKDLQRHPAKPRLVHADFMRVSKNVAITVNVPLHFTNEDTCIGVKQQGGLISHTITEIEISCLPANLPEYIEVDMAELEVDQNIHLSEIKIPEGVEVLELTHGEDHDQIVAAIHMPKAETEPTEEDGATNAGDVPAATDDSSDGDDSEG